MKPSTRLLWNWFLPGLLLGAGVQFLGFFFVIVNGGMIWEKWVPLLAAEMALLLTLLQRLHMRLFNLSRFFPIEARQAAWVPILAGATLWGVGLFVQLTGQLYSVAAGNGTAQMFIDYWRESLPSLPCLCFLMLIALDVFRSNSDRFSQSWLILFYPLIYIRQLLPWISWASFAWPLFIAGVVALIRAAPDEWATLRRQGYTWKEGNVSSSYEINEGGRKLSTPAQDLAHMILYGIAAFVLLAWLDTINPWQNTKLLLSEQFLTRLKTHPGHLFYPVVMALAPFILGVAFWWLHSTALASGIPRRRAWLAAVLKLSFVFEPLARRMGMQRGNLDICASCHRRRFVWQTRCPHCQQAEARQPEAAPVKPPAFWDMDIAEEGNAATGIYRLIIPVMLVVLTLLILKTK